MVALSPCVAGGGLGLLAKRLSAEVGGAGGAGVEVFAAEAVAVAFEARGSLSGG